AWRAAGATGGQGVQPALALLVSGALAAAAAAPAELRRVTRPDELVEQAHGQAGGGPRQRRVQEQAARAGGVWVGQAGAGRVAAGCCNRPGWCRWPGGGGRPPAASG